MTYRGQLSKWWTTQSCADAFKRAEARKRESIEKMKQSVKAKQDKLRADVEADGG